MNRDRLARITTAVAIALAVASCDELFCDYSCQEERVEERIDRWSSTVMERCEWTVGRSIDEIEARYQLDLARSIDGDLVDDTSLSPDGNLEFSVWNCGISHHCRYDRLDTEDHSVLCRDGSSVEDAARDAGSCIDRQDPYTDWACINCEHGPEACCNYRMRFDDMPEVLQSDYAKYMCNNDCADTYYSKCREIMSCSGYIIEATNAVWKLDDRWQWENEPCVGTER